MGPGHPSMKNTNKQTQEGDLINTALFTKVPKLAFSRQVKYAIQKFWMETQQIFQKLASRTAQSVLWPVSNNSPQQTSQSDQREICTEHKSATHSCGFGCRTDEGMEFDDKEINIATCMTTVVHFLTCVSLLVLKYQRSLQ